MELIIPEHPHGALSLPVSTSEERRVQAAERLARLAALDPEQLPMALTFLVGYHPRVFDAILNAVEPCAETGDTGEPAGQEPFCTLCGAPVGIFLAHGKEYPPLPRRPRRHQQAQALQGRPCPYDRLAPGHGRHRPGMA